MPHLAEETCTAAMAHLRGGGESIQEVTNKPKVFLDKKESMQSEKQILVDPISLRESVSMIYHPAGPKMEVMSVPAPLHNLRFPSSSKSSGSSGKFISCSLPSSASSSPRFDSTFAKHKKKCKIRQQGPGSVLARQHSVALSNLERLRESHWRRSKSCGEGRACQPSVDFDLWSTTNDKMDNGVELVRVGKEDEEQEERVKFHKKKGCEDGGEPPYEDKFKCGACLFLPGFGKAKAVRARKEMDPERGGTGHVDIVVSQRVSLEKFECGSWRSSAIINYEEDGDTSTPNLFFDLPVELIRCSSVNDTESPVTTGFVFDNNNNKDNHHCRLRKGALKNTTMMTTTITCSSSGQPRKSHESCNSSRHVRFSTSSPSLCPASPTSSCITPRLRKARDDFNAFLEAQSA